MSSYILPQTRTLLSISQSGLRHRALRAATTVAGSIGVVAMLVALLSIAEGYRKVMLTSAADDSVLILMDGASAEISSSIPLDEVALIRQSKLSARGANGAMILSAEPFTTAKLPGREPAGRCRSCASLSRRRCDTRTSPAAWLTFLACTSGPTRRRTTSPSNPTRSRVS
jgi:hypothetical protein